MCLLGAVRWLVVSGYGKGGGEVASADVDMTDVADDVVMVVEHRQRGYRLVVHQP